MKWLPAAESARFVERGLLRCFYLCFHLLLWERISRELLILLPIDERARG